MQHHTHTRKNKNEAPKISGAREFKAVFVGHAKKYLRTPGLRRRPKAYYCQRGSKLWKNCIHQKHFQTWLVVEIRVLQK